MSAAPGSERTLVGLPISPGVAVGPVLFWETESTEVPRRRLETAQIEAEIERFRSAVKEAEEELERQKRDMKSQVSGTERQILESHLQFYRDSVFRQEIEQRIRGELLNGESAVHDQVQHLVRALEGMDQLFRERIADIRDVGTRLVRILLRKAQARIESGGAPFVLYARELLPSETMHLDRSRLLGIMTEVGGEASHVAILARAFRIPAVSGIKSLKSKIAPGSEVGLDGTLGRVLLLPMPEEKQSLLETRRVFLQERELLAQRAAAHSRAEEQSGVEVLLNIENFDELEPELLKSTQGIGLYRTEFLFMNRSLFPSEEEQFTFYRGVLDRVGDREVTFRTIDVGGDKPLQYLQTPREQNPALGWRGIRMANEWPDLLIPQLRALLRAGAFGRLKILLPMVTNVEEVREARRLLQRLSGDLERDGSKFNPHVPLGVMIEVPSAAIAAGDLCEEADFLSVGTNDLVQYLFAVDRNNLNVARLYQPLHPALLRLLRSILRDAESHHSPVTICGEMAGQSLPVLALLALGVQRFSMSPAHVPEARWMFEQFTAEEARSLADELLAMKTETEVEAALAKAVSAVRKE